MSGQSLFNACNHRRSADRRRDLDRDDRKRLRCDVYDGNMDSTGRCDVIAEMSIGAGESEGDESRDSGFGDDEWLPNDCATKSTSDDKKKGVRLDFKGALVTSSLSVSMCYSSAICSNGNAQCAERSLNMQISS
jgi:hypothetical protein